MTDLLSQEQTQDQALPDGWTTASLQELSDINPRFGKDELPEDLEVTFLPMKCVEELSGKIDTSNSKRVSEVRKSYTPFQEEDVIFAKITPCMENGKIAVARGLKNKVGFGSSEFHVIRPHESVSRDFLFYFLVRSDFRKEAERNMTGSAGQRRVPTSYIKEAVVPLPPLNEQRRIVEKIEELFTKLDAGVRSLEQAQALLKSYRRSVLKAAVEGELSREWREAHRDEIEPASGLLERILQERREKFAGKKYKEPASADTSELPVLPDGWVWASLGQLLTDIEAGKNFKCREKPPDDTELGLVKISSVTWGVFNEIESKTVTDLSKENPEHLIYEGDFLFSRANTLELVGACVIVHAISRRLLLSDKVLRFRFVRDSLKRWILFYLRSYRGRQQIESLATGNQLSMRNISQASIHRIAVPLPSAVEMEFIVEEVERRLSMVDKLEANVEANLMQAGGLRQSILKQAFSGELVPQDPDDEPADVLLERIRDERQATKKSEKRRKSKGSLGKSDHAEQRGLF